MIKYCITIEDYCQNHSLSSLNGIELMKKLIKKYEDFLIIEKWLYYFFRYLDRFYIEYHEKMSLKQCSKRTFRTLIFDMIKKKTTKAVLELITLDRNNNHNNNTINRSLISNILKIYISMGNYLEDTSILALKRKLKNINPKIHINTQAYQLYFETDFLQSTSIYYKNKCNDWLNLNNNLAIYLRQVERIISLELERLNQYLHHSTKKSLLSTLYQVLLLDRQQDILNYNNTEQSGLDMILQQHKKDDLKRLYQLYYNTNNKEALDIIAIQVANYIQSICMKLINKFNIQENKDILQTGTYVKALMSIHNTFLKLIEQCLPHPIFQKHLNNKMILVLSNKVQGITSEELLASFINFMLKKTGLLSKLPIDAQQQMCNSLITLFGYCNHKDIFLEYYKKHLSKRLLLQRTYSIDLEKYVISLLKVKCGTRYTNKLEGILHDMNIAKKTQIHFIQYQQQQKLLKVPLASSASSSIDLKVTSLTAGNWPSYKSHDHFKLSPIMQQTLTTYETFYHTTTKDRKLKWIHQLGTVVIAGYFNERRIDLTVNTIQAVILTLINEQHQLANHQGITIQSLIDQIGLSATIIKQNLKSMVSGKYKILKKYQLKVMMYHIIYKLIIILNQHNVE